MSTSRTCLLKTRLIHHFGNALTFHRPQERNVFEYVFSSKVSQGPIVEKCAKALKTLDNFKETAASMDIDAEWPEFEESPGPTLFRAALCLRSNAMDGATGIPFLPPKPTDISDQAASQRLKYRLHPSTSLHGFSLATTRRKVFLCMRRLSLLLNRIAAMFFQWRRT